MTGTARAIVRAPSAQLEAGELTHQERLSVDFELAAHQHGAYVDLIRSMGYTVVFAPDLADHPDGVFVEDTMTMVGSTCVLARPGAVSRRAEIVSMRATLVELGLRPVELAASGSATFDGGDVLLTERHLFVGLSTRSNQAAIDALAPVANTQGCQVTGVPVTRCLHLKTGITALPDGALIHNDYIDAAPFVELGYQMIHTPEPNGANVLVLGKSVVVSAEAVETAARLREHRYDVQTIDISEFHKLEAGLTCLSVLLNR
jgi:dimethylargininase